MSDKERDELGDYTKPLRDKIEEEKHKKALDDKSYVGWVQVFPKDLRQREIAELAEKLFVQSCHLEIFEHEDTTRSGIFWNAKAEDCFEDATKFIKAKDKFLSEGEK